MTHEQIQQIFNEDSDHDEFLNKFAGFSTSYTRVRFCRGGVIGAKTWCVAYTSATYTRARTKPLSVLKGVYLYT